MREPIFTDFIAEMPDVVPKPLCEEFIEIFERLQTINLTHQGVTGSGVNKRAKLSRDVEISRFSMFQEHLVELNKHMQSAYEKYVEKYWVVNELMAHHETTAWQIQKYSAEERGAYFNFHHEAGNRNSMNRVMTYLIYLNDIDEGGETEFLYQGLRVKPEAGKIVYFPAYFTHVHRGNPVLSGQDKYILTGWLELV